MEPLEIDVYGEGTSRFIQSKDLARSFKKITNGDQAAAEGALEDLIVTGALRPKARLLLAFSDVAPSPLKFRQREPIEKNPPCLIESAEVIKFLKGCKAARVDYALRYSTAPRAVRKPTVNVNDFENLHWHNGCETLSYGSPPPRRSFDFETSQVFEEPQTQTFLFGLMFDFDDFSDWCFSQFRQSPRARLAVALPKEKDPERGRDEALRPFLAAAKCGTLREYVDAGPSPKQNKFEVAVAEALPGFRESAARTFAKRLIAINDEQLINDSVKKVASLAAKMGILADS